MAMKPNRVAGRLQNVLGRPFAWCKGLVNDTHGFAGSIAKLFDVPIESVFVGLGRQAIRAEATDKKLALEESRASLDAA